MVLSQMDAGKALTAAAAKGNVPEVQRILEECRVHPDTVNEFGYTALQVMMMGSPSVAVLLLDRGADPNVQDRHGVTPLHDAARAGFADTVSVLLQRGAAANAPDGGGALPLHAAVRHGHRDVVALLAPLSDLQRANTRGRTPVDEARASPLPGMVDLLFAHVHS